MKNLTRALAVAIAIMFITASAPADAGRGAKPATAQASKARAARAQSARAQAAPAKPISPQKSSALIRARLKRDGKSTDVTMRKSQDHPKTHEYAVANNTSKKVTKYQVAKDGSRVRKAGGKVTQAQARAIANKQLRRENGAKGAFSGVQNSGITKNGNYKFTSKTDKNEVLYVNANTGATRRVDK